MRISLAQWSLHRAIFAGALRPLDFPRVARRDFSIDAIELVNGLMPGSRPQQVEALRRVAAGEGVKVLLIMVDDEGDLGHGPAYRFHDPDDRLFEIYYETERYQPPDDLAPAMLNQHQKRTGRGVGVRRLEHVNFVSPDFYGYVWDRPSTTFVLGGALFWMFVGNLIMRRMVNFKF